MIFSIIVPVYNTAVHLPACIDSLLAQSCGDFELVLVDDGSTDGSAEICREAVARDPRVKVIHQANQGVSRARNAGLEAARGQYVTWIDSDDTVVPEMLADARELFARSACDLVIFSMRYLNTANGGLVVRDRVLPDRVFTGPGEMAEEMIRRGGFLIYSAGNKFYRRELLDRHGIRFPVDLHYGEDRLFNYDYLRVCAVVATSSRVVYHYYSRGTPSLSGRYRPTVARDLLELHEAKRSLLLALGVPESRMRGYLAADIRRELLQAVAHAGRHWRGLPRSERRRLVRSLVHGDYPDYLREASTPRWVNRLMLSLLRCRLEWAVYGLAWIRFGFRPGFGARGEAVAAV